MVDADPGRAGADRLEAAASRERRYRTMAGVQPARYRPNLAIAQAELALALLEAGRPAEAARAVGDAEATLGGAHPGGADLRGRALDLFERAVEAVPRHDPDRPELMSRLGAALRHVYEQTHEVGALRRALTIGDEAVRNAPENHPAKAAVLSDLGTTQVAEYRLTGDRRDLESAMISLSTAVSRAVNPRQREQLYRYRWLFGDACLMWYAQSGDPRDLDQAVDELEAAVAAIPADAAELPEIHASAGRAWLARFERTGDAGARAAALEHLRRAAAATAEDDPRRRLFLSAYAELRPGERSGEGPGEKPGDGRGTERDTIGPDRDR